MPLPRSREDIIAEINKINTLQSEAIRVFGNNSHVFITLFGLNLKMRSYASEIHHYLEQIIDGKLPLPPKSSIDDVKGFYSRLCSENRLNDRYAQVQQPACSQQNAA